LSSFFEVGQLEKAKLVIGACQDWRNVSFSCVNKGGLQSGQEPETWTWGLSISNETGNRQRRADSFAQDEIYNICVNDLGPLKKALHKMREET